MRPSTTVTVPESDEPAVMLLREALDETRQLVKLEAELARDELRADLAGLKRAAMALGAAAVLAIAALTMLLVSAAAAFSSTFSRMWVAALVLGAILLASSGALAVIGWRRVPKDALRETRRSLAADVTQLKERASA